MKTYSGVRLYSKNTPQPWYIHDNPLSLEYNMIEPYNFTHLLPNKHTIEYNIDKYGFRNTNNDMQNNLWFFGCSHTFGEALSYENTFPYIISRDLDMPYYNFATVGASIDLVVRQLYRAHVSLLHKTVVILLPYIERYETIKGSQFINLIPQHKEYTDYLPKNIEDFLNYRLLKNIITLKLLNCKNIHYFLVEQNKLLVDSVNAHIIPQQLLVDKAQDNMHFGEKTNKNIANYIANIIK